MLSFPRSDAAGVLRTRPALQHAVERAQVCAGARLDDVGRGTLPGDQRAVEIDLHRHLAQGVLAGGRRADGVILQSARSLNPLNARSRSPVARSKPRSLSRAASACRPECLPRTSLLDGRPMSLGFMIS